MPALEMTVNCVHAQKLFEVSFEMIFPIKTWIISFHSDHLDLIQTERRGMHDGCREGKSEW